MTLLNILNKKPTTDVAASDSASEVQERFVRPRYRIVDTEDVYTIDVDVPGVSKAGVDITLEDGVLEIQARRSWQTPEGWSSFNRDEAGLVYRLRLAIGDGINDEGIKAEVEDGVLQLTLPKAEALKPRKISVN